MANRIKGLTVEIDGSTTGLDKALKNVNTNEEEPILLDNLHQLPSFSGRKDQMLHTAYKGRFVK